VTYFRFLILLRARRAAQPVCSRAIQALAHWHALNQNTLKHWQENFSMDTNAISIEALLHAISIEDFSMPEATMPVKL
jgi:hypothetical protein